ncbi:site-specific DNA-methyltransferase [Polycyclovorans algicola]|uniref:site-specific DNA-methyltransferase n=1 Tax=Polycyclovorans algicola TaxID=616992 RepID=UPI0004A72853|nr:site-specific DNA-methyltransferase [Polycyclovorans algicola]
MPKAPAYDLTDADKRDLIELIQRGQPLPEKYRFVLFEDKREVELVWNGKTRDVCTTVLPFQSLEHIDEPRAETKSQHDLFDSRGRQHSGWTNKLIWGDNKLILSSLKSGALRQQIEEAGGLKLIYIDPPFDVGADFSMDIEIGGETFHKEPNLLEQIAYRDTWGRGADSFISMIYERLILMRDLLAEDGSIYVHCDWRVNSFIRLVLDEVFGREFFKNEITWRRQPPRGARAVASQYARTSDNLVFFTRAETYGWNPQFREYSEAYIASKFTMADADGRRYRVGDVGDYSPKSIDAFRVQGKIYDYPSGKFGLKRYLDEQKGEVISDIWDDISEVNAMAIERLDYPTQKPEALLERIIKASSNEGDLVADFFCGSGTTAAVAEKLGRKWIATDLGKFGIHTTRKRLIQVQRELKAKEQNFRAFEVLNLGRYQREAYLGLHFALPRHSRESGNPEPVEEKLDSRLRGNDGNEMTRQKRQRLVIAQKEREFRELILRAYKAQPLDNDAFFHGRNANRLVAIGPINLPVGRLFVEEVITECRKRGATRVDVLAFEFEMGLFPAVLEEARQKGIDLTPRYIPADVFDKRAVDKGQVVFHDISFVEATPRYDKKNSLKLSIELTDFSVYYTQGAAEAAIAAIKEGKSSVVCDTGQLVKVSKTKDGVVNREVLTKHWTDWVDYWAVDFDYQSRKEIIKVAKSLDLMDALPGMEPPQASLVEYEARWTGGYIFENEWQSFRTRRSRDLELITAEHCYEQPGRYIVAVKVIDIFGNDTMTLVPVNVG